MNQDLIYTNNQNEDFTILIQLLDEDLSERYGELQKQYNKHNKVDYINDVIILYEDRMPVACGAFKEYDPNSVELKRIFVKKDQRGKRFARTIVKELENSARNQKYKYAVLETGSKQYEAINLYKSCGYEIIPNYGPYENNSNSICMKKEL